MSIYSNVTEQDLINLRKLAQQHQSQRVEKFKNRILEKTHDVKLAKSLSPITKKLDETSEKLGDFIKESNKNLGNFIKENNTPQPAIENTPTSLPIENEKIQPGVIYTTSLENTLSNMRTNSGFLNIKETDDGEIFWNGFPVKKMGGNKLKINEKIHNITSGILKVLTETSNIPLKKLNGKDRKIFNNILESLDFENYKPIRGESKSGRHKKSKSNFKKHNLEGQGIEKIIIPSNIIDIHNRLEVLLGLKLSGHTNTFSESSNLIDELYKRGEIETRQQYLNALDKFSK